MMRLVVIFDHLLGSGGVPYETRALIGALVEAGADVTAICDELSPTKHMKSSQVIDDFAKGDDRLPPVRMRYGIFSVLKTLHTPKHDMPVYLLIGCRRAHYLLFAAAIRMRGARSYLFTHGLLTPELLKHGWGGRSKGTLRQLIEVLFNTFVEKPLLRLVSAARALSYTEASWLVRCGGGHILTVADGVDRDWLCPNTACVAPPLSGKVCLLYMGRPEAYQKGLDLILDALKNIPEAESRIELTLAGPDVHIFKSIVVGVFGVEPAWVKIVGMISGGAKARAFSSAHFFVHVSRFEGMAKSAREAVGQGLPVIASYESNFGDWVKIYGMGIATSANSESVRHAVYQALDLPQTEWQRMSAAARSFAERQSWNKVAAELMHDVELSSVRCSSGEYSDRGPI